MDGSITVLRREPRLMILPIISGVAVIILLGGFVGWRCFVPGCPASGRRRFSRHRSTGRNRPRCRLGRGPFDAALWGRVRSAIIEKQKRHLVGKLIINEW